MDTTYLTLSERVPSDTQPVHDRETFARERLTDLLELRDRAAARGLTDLVELYTDALIDEMLGGRKFRAAPSRGRAA